MEALCLLCSITATLIKSTALSLLLPLRSVLSSDDVTLYEGHVTHVRRRPAPHSFVYRVRYALFDLDRASVSSSHLSADQARHVASTDGHVLLLTIPASVGYEQNPLSVYYCYDADDHEQPKMCIAEVTNTPWGEKVMFSFRPGSDLVAKPLHVSPFMDMIGNWNILADAPGDDLFLAISSQHPTLGNYFTATLNAKRVRSSSSSLDQALFFWLMPHKVAVWIYLQAMKLWWKNVAFLAHPKYMNPKYREDALLRDQQLCCPRNIKQNGDNPNHGGDQEEHRNRWCVWKDAQWPWS